MPNFNKNFHKSAILSMTIANSVSINVPTVNPDDLKSYWKSEKRPHSQPIVYQFLKDYIKQQKTDRVGDAEEQLPRR